MADYQLTQTGPQIEANLTVTSSAVTNGGIGYLDAGSTTNREVTWDGDITGRAHVDFLGFFDFYKVSDDIILDASYLSNGTVYNSDEESLEWNNFSTLTSVLTEFEATVASGDPNKVFLKEDYFEIYVVFSTEAQTITGTTAEGLDFSITFPAGTFFYKCDDYYINKFTYTYTIPAGTVHKISNAYMPFAGLPSVATAGDAMVYNGSSWAKQSGYGYEYTATVDAAETITFEEGSYGYYQADLGTTYLQNTKELLNSNHEGESITISLDGTNYTCSIVSEAGGTVYLAADNMDDPTVALEYMPAQSVYMALVWNSTETSHTISVTGKKINTIDPKYISEDGYGYITNNSKKGFTVTWDGDTTGKSSHTTPTSWMLYKVDDTVYSADDILGCIGSGYFGGSAFSLTTTEDNVTYDSHGGVVLYYVSGLGNKPLCIFSDGSYIYSSTTFEAGVWFYKGSDTYRVSELTSVHKIDSKYLPETSGLPTGTAAGNALIFDGDEWTQQDGYGYDVTSNLIKDVSVTYSDDNQAICTNTTLATFMTDTDNIGKLMSVTVDNTTYECVVQSETYDGDTDLIIGNMNICGSRYEDTGEPFCIVTIGSETTRIYWEESISATKTFTINEIDRHTIDNKYIENADIVEKAVESAGIGYGKSIKLNTVNIGTSVTVNYTSGSEAFTLYKIGTMADVEDALGEDPTEIDNSLGIDLTYGFIGGPVANTKMYSTEYTYDYGDYICVILKRDDPDGNSAEYILVIVSDNSSAITIDSRFQAITFPSTGVWSVYEGFGGLL